LNIREAETVETLAPRRHTWNPLALMFLFVCFLAAAAGIAVSVSPRVRSLVGMAALPPVPLKVASTPDGADVFIDDEHVGRTPLEVQVSPTPHVVRIVRSGHRPWRQDVDPSLTPDVSAPLERIALASLEITSDPDHASVFLDDAYRGATPLVIPNIEAGSHALRVEKGHVYQPALKPIDLEAGQTLKLDIALASNLESYYHARIKEEPGALSNYTELVHIHVLDRAAPKAVAVIVAGLKALKTGETEAAEISRFYSELKTVYAGSAGPLDAATSKTLLDGILTLFEQLASVSGASYTTYTPLATFLLQAGRTADVIAVCDKVSGTGKRPGYVHYQVGRAVAKTTGGAAALAILQRSIELNAKYYPAHYYIGTIHHRAGTLDKALASYEAAEKLLASGASSYYQGLIQYNIARICAARADVAGAIKRYEAALAVKTSASYSNEWRLSYAQFLATNGKKEEAIKHYTVLRTSSASNYTTVKAAAAALKQLGVKKEKKK